MSWIVTIPLTDEQADEISDRLWDLGTTGLAEVPDTPNQGIQLLAGFDNEDLAEVARAEFGGTIAPIDPSSWNPPPAAEIAVGTHVLTIDAGHSFGHGTHPTTQLCLRALEAHLRAGHHVLDVGCGSGVLALAANVLGAASVTAIDIDPAAITATSANATSNGVEVDVSATDVSQLAGTFDVVVVNMLVAELEPIADHLRRLTGDLIIVSGALIEQRDRVRAAVGVGATVVEETTDGTWIGDTLRVTRRETT